MRLAISIIALYFIGMSALGIWSVHRNREVARQHHIERRVSEFFGSQETGARYVLTVAGVKYEN